MNEIIMILRQIRNDLDYTKETALIDEGVFDSFNTIELVGLLEDKFGIEIPPTELTPENFNSAAQIVKMVERLNK